MRRYATRRRRGAWEYTLKIKGIAGARTRTANAVGKAEPEVAAIQKDLQIVRNQIARVVFDERENADRAETLKQLNERQESMERELFGASDFFRADVAIRNATAPTLCEHLPPETAVVDILRYGRDGGDAYLAFAMNASDCAVHHVALGSAAPLDEAIRQWRDTLSDPRAARRRVDQRGERVAALLWEPLAAVVTADHWFVVPDAATATVPFGALPLEGGRYVVEDHAITYLDRANDLLTEPAGEPDGALVIGGVDYDARLGASEGERAHLAQCNAGGHVPLPGTLTELDAFTTHWTRKKRRGPVRALKGALATESAARAALPGRAVAHIATHGFFATGACREALLSGLYYDPMLLSGLALAGANQPPDPTANDDGILTASEVAGLDLSSTGLVVLSACETGIGEANPGQGVLGLRRAFAIAGAHALIMSLWSIPDDPTAQLMDRLYTHHLGRKGQSAADSLRQAQLDMLAAQRAVDRVHPFEWAAFIASGRGI